MTTRQVVLVDGTRGVQLLEDRSGKMITEVYCWCHKRGACNTACAAFRLDDNEIYCLALPVLGAQGIARLVAPKKTLLDAHAESVEAAERDEIEEDEAANKARREFNEKIKKACEGMDK